MTSFFHHFVTNRLSRMRVCLLYLLAMVCVSLIFGLNRPSTLPVSGDEDAPLPADALAGLIVAIDPGHGGYDGGAKAVDSGKWEKELNLQIALHVERALTAHGAAVVLTRREDKALSGSDTSSLSRKRKDLQARVDIALEAKATVLLSIHLNEYRSRKESGPQVFFQHGGEDGRLLAGVLQAALLKELQPPKRRVAMAGNYFVLRSAIPSVLVECGFLSNAEEEKLLLSEAYQKRIANALVRGLADYVDLLSRQGRTPQEAYGEMPEEGP